MLADSAVGALSRGDWQVLAGLVAESGAWFSPYGHLDSSLHLRFGPEQIAAFGSDTTRYVWGRYDGTGKPIALTPAGYLDRFIYDADYVAARKGQPDEYLAWSNTIANIEEFFGPEATFLAYHQEGSERYGGMDWRSLRLVFQQHHGRWRLVGVVHAEWTI